MKLRTKNDVHGLERIDAELAAIDAAPEPQTLALPAKPDQPNSGEAA